MANNILMSFPVMRHARKLCVKCKQLLCVLHDVHVHVRTLYIQVYMYRPILVHDCASMYIVSNSVHVISKAHMNIHT